MIELVSEERLEEVVRAALAANFFSIPRRVRLAVGRAVLGEVGVVRVIDIAETATPHHWIGGVDVKEALRNGAVLVRARRKEEKP